MHIFRNWLIMLAAPPVLLPGVHVRAQSDMTAEHVAFFEAKIRPVLVKHCYKCHSADAKELKGGLRLDLKAGWQTGGE